MIMLIANDRKKEISYSRELSNGCYDTQFNVIVPNGCKNQCTGFIVDHYKHTTQKRGENSIHTRKISERPSTFFYRSKPNMCEHGPEQDLMIHENQCTLLL